MDRSRNVSFDILRIIAAFSVVVLHVSSRYIMLSSVNDANFVAANIYDSISRFGVPVFVMISGALFLNNDKEIDMKRLWLHNILRLFIVYLVWSYGYYMFQSLYEWKFDLFHQSLIRTATGIAYATDHLWFLGMMVGLYALVPVLKAWVKKATKQNLEYFILLFLVFGILRTTITLLLDSSLAYKLTDTFKIIELTGYLGYFVLGYYLSTYPVTKRMKYGFYLSVPVDILLNYLVSWKMSENSGYYNPGIYDSFGVFTFLEVVALFLAITSAASRKKENRLTTLKLLRNVAADTLGVYLMHVMVLDFIYKEGYLNYLLPSALWVLPVSIGIFVVTALVSALLRRIPYVGRYIC